MLPENSTALPPLSLRHRPSEPKIRHAHDKKAAVAVGWHLGGSGGCLNHLHPRVGNIDAWRACYTDDAMWTHNKWSANKPIDELADIHRQFHEMAEDVVVSAANFELVTMMNGTKFVHAWLQFRAKYKSGEVADTTCFLGLRVAEHNRFAYEVGIYDTASLPKASPYGEGEDGK